MTPAVVTGLDKGITITGVLRLIGSHFSRQRGSRWKGNRPWIQRPGTAPY